MKPDTGLFEEALRADDPIPLIRSMTAVQRMQYDVWLTAEGAKRFMRAAAFVAVPDGISPGNCVAAIHDTQTEKRMLRMQALIAGGGSTDGMLREKLRLARSRHRGEAAR